jgi:hypothetical protein
MKTTNNFKAQQQNSYGKKQLPQFRVLFHSCNERVSIEA